MNSIQVVWEFGLNRQVWQNLGYMFEQTGPRAFNNNNNFYLYCAFQGTQGGFLQVKGTKQTNRPQIEYV